MDYNRTIQISIDIRAVRCQIREIIDESIGEGGVEYCVQDALKHVYYEQSTDI